MKPLGARARVLDRSSWAVAVAAAGLAMVVSYAGQRVAAALVGESGGVLWHSVHTPYFWRVGVAALHGSVVGVTVALLVTPDRSPSALGWLRCLAAPVVVLCGVAMAVWP